LGGADLRGADLVGALGGPYTTSNEVRIKFPNQIEINGEVLTIEEWEQVISQRGFDLLTLATYEAYKVFLQKSRPNPVVERPSRFERIS
jgi:hypothetical protein